MLSISKKPFPIIKGKDATRLAAALRDSSRMPLEGTLDYKLINQKKNHHPGPDSPSHRGRILYED